MKLFQKDHEPPIDATNADSDESRSATSTRKLLKSRKLLLFAAVVLLASGAGALLLRKLQPAPTQTDAVLADQSVVAGSTDEPDETPPENYQWNGGALEPKRIIIPSIKVDSYLQSVGLDKQNRVAVPTNIHLGGWFTDSARPGEPGLSIIDGHVSGRTTNGVFRNLSKLTSGDTFQVERGDGKLLQFRVIKTQTVPDDQANVPLFAQDSSVISQLNLITCGGDFDQTSLSFADRVIVSGELVTDSSNTSTPTRESSNKSPAAARKAQPGN